MPVQKNMLLNTLMNMKTRPMLFQLELLIAEQVPRIKFFLIYP